MKKIFLAILLGSLGGVTIGLATSPPQKVVRAVAEYREAKAINKVKGTSHVIAMDSPVTGPSGCSATAIGPHALLTASHCEKPDGFVTVDGEKGVPIVKVIRDGDDHSILFLEPKSVRFLYTARFVNRPLKVGEFVFIWGNPGDSGVQFVAILRTGKFEAQNIFKNRITDVFDLACEHGDSGSAIFDINGNIVDVLSIGGSLSIPNYGDVGNATGALRVKFPPEVFEEAAKF
jgi:hypothetical protein